MFQACMVQTWVKCGSRSVIQSASCTISKNFSSSCKSLARIQSPLAIKPRKPPRATVVKASIGGAFSKGGRSCQSSSRRSRLSQLCICAETQKSRAANPTSAVL